jgi:hypothetical protein
MIGTSIWNIDRDIGIGYRIWDIDMGDDSIDMVILNIGMGYRVTLGPTRCVIRLGGNSSCASAKPSRSRPPPRQQGLTLVHFSAQLERFVWDRGARRGCVGRVKGVSWGV